MSLEKCDKDVFEKGQSLGLFDMTKEQAEQHCLTQTKETGDKHDWHYVAGRVHIKRLAQK